MKKINIFNPKYIDLFLPDDGVEFLYNIIYGLGYTHKELSSKQAKSDTLFVIEELLKFDLIYVFSWGKNHDEMKNKTYTIKETISYIDSIWFEGADFPDFYGMVMFGHKKWYVEKLKRLCLTETTNWENFVKDKIGDLEKWIEENKPKKK